MQSRVNSTQFINYKLAGKRNSILTMQDSATNNQSEFTSANTIACTREHFIRKFKNQDDEMLIVKSPIESIEKESYESSDDFNFKYKSEKQDITNEYSFLKQAYPNEEPYHLEMGTYQYTTKSIWTYRLIMPFITGQMLDEFIREIDNPIDYLSFILAIAIELNRIHQLGIIHGDVKYNNAFATRDNNKGEYHIHFIDFDRANSINDQYASTTNEWHAVQWAPERRDKNRSILAPNFNQDVYSFGFMLLTLMDINLQFGNKNGKFNDKFPMLFSTLNKTQRIEPSERPKMDEIILDINNEIKKLTPGK